MAHPSNRVEFVCEICHKTFSLKVSAVRQRGGTIRFCSRACRNVMEADKHELVTCKTCGKEFATYKKFHRQYCSQSCAITARNLTDANPAYHRDISGEKNPMYGKPGCRGERNGMYGVKGADSPAWHGGHKTRADGYSMVYAPPDHPIHSQNVEPYILEHRLLMEQHLGRYLTEDEVVHHIDGNPSNNVIENLQLFANQSEHISKGHPGLVNEWRRE